MGKGLCGEERRKVLPKWKIHKSWLSLFYRIPAKRHKKQMQQLLYWELLKNQHIENSASYPRTRMDLHMQPSFSTFEWIITYMQLRTLLMSHFSPIDIHSIESCPAKDIGHPLHEYFSLDDDYSTLHRYTTSIQNNYFSSAYEDNRPKSPALSFW